MYAYQPTNQQESRKMKMLAPQKISEEMHAFLSEQSMATHESIASVVRGLIRKAMDESKTDNRAV